MMGTGRWSLTGVAAALAALSLVVAVKPRDPREPESAPPTS
jgi:hypothetical protein